LSGYGNVATSTDVKPVKDAAGRIDILGRIAFGNRHGIARRQRINSGCH
jgi:hypothetical protein